MSKKILYIANYRKDVGGISGQVDVLLEKLDKTNYQTDLLNTKTSLFKRFLLFLTSRKQIKNSDVIHVHCCSNFGGFFPAILGIIMGKLHGKKVIITYHGGDAENFISKNKWIVIPFLRKADELIVLSDFLEKVFLKFKLKTKLIPNIFEIQDSRSISKTEILPNFISTRALNKLYNIDLILDAFSAIQKEIPNALLTILGDGTERETLKAKCLNEKIENVHFIGKVPNQEVRDYLKKNDFLLSAPSIDNFPISILEAFENELLVISSNVGGVPFLIENFKNGLLFESKNVNDLVKMIKFAIQDKQNSLKMVENAKLRLFDFSWDANCNKFDSIYLL
jgi:glycosyltransferase involved in cell wall biosynthesis